MTQRYRSGEDGNGDNRSARWQRRRSTATRQGGLDGKKRASPMGTRGSPAAPDHRDGDDSSSAGRMAQRRRPA
ncbi:hypothetical protein E2562_033898, partial [Oryza meyeriana var. granulata]